MALTEFGGNRPANVARDAKYSLRRGRDGWAVRLEYRLDGNERLLLSTGDHPDLVGMVLDVQEESRGMPGGAFYINEFSQVLAPSGAEGRYFLAGSYPDALEFRPKGDPDVAGWVISGDGKGRDGRRLAAGDQWLGPHPGIPYVLAADHRNVYYELMLSPIRRRRVTLSEQVGLARAQTIAQQVYGVKREAGRFYINEFCQMFCPVWDGHSLTYNYIGALDLDAGWFAKWEPA